jgi:hypothetical protein
MSRNEQPMSLEEIDVARSEHPVDTVERMATVNDWSFERQEDDEISISVGGRWCDYHVAFTWLEDMEALHVACAFDIKVPDRRKGEILQLLSAINEQLWVGHFDLWSSDDVVMFRHALVLAGGLEANHRQCEMILKLALDACEKHYQAFQFVLWAGKSAREAMEATLFETAGHA